MKFPVVPIECINNFFGKLPDVEKDQKITVKLVKEHVDCIHRNAVSLTGMLELFGFINKDATPTEVWWHYQEDPQATLRPIIEERYACLYERYDDPYQQSPRAISEALTSVTNRSDLWGKHAARCFRALYEVANTKAVSVSPEIYESVAPKSGVTISIYGLQGTALIDQDLVGALSKYL
ncbi:DUF5343 domain-containing protein [Amycolatopsis sp., V23-08]|uniref:DUF5343 domain-containing protein n=1 Tax=Amycolatopsis heterodermiae TaxID=3110235 RepID=A0ABU5QZ85_9PSEU|nr:DUF5343 domain-containing protein [Amycolatopsis sp., V23-08]MEA5358744.1 DUF5343 domain-containing protein [Amycolatopsis sp., V23-08]